MRDKEIDDILKQAGQAPPSVNPALLDRVADSVGASLRPVRPLPPAWALAGGLALICAAVALGGAARSGFYGIRALSASERGLIFSTLAILILLGSAVAAGEMIQGTRQGAAPGTLLAAGSFALLAVFAIVFHDYGTVHFFSQGIVCLSAGLFHAVPAAVASWFLVRRGFAVNRIAAGAALGTLAGLAGVSMLELHCANLEALHVMLWHTAVIPLSAAAGAVSARIHFLREHR